MRCSIISFSIAYCCMAIQGSAQDTIRWVQSTNYSDNLVRQEISRKLDEPSPIAGMDKALSLKKLMSLYPLVVLLDKKALEEESLTPDELIVLPMIPGITIRNQLRFILEPLQLTYVEKPGYLLITSKKSSANVVCLYDVTNLVRSAIGKYNFSPLFSVIERSIDEDNWQAAGGNSSMTEWRTPSAAILVVSAPDETQEAIRDLFSAKKELLTRSSSSLSTRRLQATELRIGVRRSALR